VARQLLNIVTEKKVKRAIYEQLAWLQGLFLGIQKLGQRKGKFRQHTSESLRECLQKSSGHSPLLDF